MYTYAVQFLHQKTFRELKAIACDCAIVPARDRRCRQSWIDALVNVNPPLLELLEVSSVAELEQVQEAIAQTTETSPGVEVDPVSEPIAQAVEISPGVEVDPVSEPIAQVVETSSGVEFDRLSEPIIETVETSPAASVEQVQEAIEVQVQELPIESKFGRIVYPRSAQKSIAQTAEISLGVENFIEADRPPNRGDNGRDRLEIELKLSQSAIELVSEIFSGVERVTEFNRNNFSGVECVTESNRNNFSGLERVTESNRNNFSGVGVDLAQKAIEVQAQEAIELPAENSPGVEVDQAQEPITPAAKKLPGSRSKASTAHQLLELFQSRAHVIEDSPGVKTEATVSESAIGLAAKNPILTRVTLSDRFCARYSSPQAEIIHFQSDADGQLSLLNFEIESAFEPPDPDDFESLDAFREAIALWDAEHPSSFDHCSDYLPSSEDNDVSSEDKPLQVSLDSFSLWAPCPHTWYEPVGLHPSSVMELLRVGDSSDTSNFSIPTFSAEGVSSNRTDEPPDTGVCARFPKPKPPSFPPTAAGQVWGKLNPNTYQTQPKLNLLCQFDCSSFLKLAYCGAIAVGRAPPGGDAM